MVHYMTLPFIEYDSFPHAVNLSCFLKMFTFFSKKDAYGGIASRALSCHRNFVNETAPKKVMTSRSVTLLFHWVSKMADSKYFGYIFLYIYVYLHLNSVIFIV